MTQVEHHQVVSRFVVQEDDSKARVLKVTAVLRTESITMEVGRDRKECISDNRVDQLLGHAAYKGEGER